MVGRNEYHKGNFSISDHGGSKNVLIRGAIDHYHHSMEMYLVEDLNNSTNSFFMQKRQFMKLIQDMKESLKNIMVKQH